MPTAIGFCRTTTQQRNTLPCQLTRGHAMIRTHGRRPGSRLTRISPSPPRTRLANNMGKLQSVFVRNLGQRTLKGSEEIFFTHLLYHILQAFNKSYVFLCVSFFRSFCSHTSRYWRGATDKISTALCLISLLDTPR